jgi:hypothetical protein
VCCRSESSDDGRALGVEFCRVLCADSVAIGSDGGAVCKGAGAGWLYKYEGRLGGESKESYESPAASQHVQKKKRKVWHYYAQDFAACHCGELWLCVNRGMQQTR